MPNIKYYAVCLTLGLFSCQNRTIENSEASINYSLTDFSVSELNLSQATQVSSDDMLIGAPVEMELINDSIITIHDAKNDNYLWLMNVNNGAYSNCLHRGEGPNESFGVNNICSEGGKLFVSSGRDNKLFEISVDFDSLHPAINCLGTVKTDVFRSVMIDDDEIIYAPFFEDSVRFIRAKIGGEPIDTIGNLDFIVSESDIIPRNNIAQMNIAFSKSNNVLVAANMGWNIIEVYDLTYNNSIILHGPVEIDSKVKKIEAPFGSTSKQSPRWEMFRNPSISKNGFDVGYIGAKISTSKDLDKKISSILCFNASGLPTKQLALSEEILCYAIDYDTMTLYFIPKDGNPVVKKYDLPLSYDDLTRHAQE